MADDSESFAADLLAEVPLFQLLSDDERHLLAAELDIVRYAVGGTVFNTGDPGDSMYVIRKGEVEVFFKDDTGEKIVLETASEGDFFGELSLLDSGPRTASVIVNQAAKDQRTTIQRAADAIAAGSGSIVFLMLHCLLFAAWIVINMGLIPDVPIFDPYPFGLLTMAVSLEAIILSVFVLLSQNRQVAKDRVRADIEYEVNLKAELEIAHLHEKLDHMSYEILARLGKPGSPPSSNK